MFDIQPDQLLNILNSEKARIGVLPANLSPYAVLIQSLAHSNAVDLEARITSGKNRRTKIFVREDMDLPDWMSNTNDKIIRV